MIKLYLYGGKKSYVAVNAIASVTEASTSSQWRGIKSFVKLFDGSVLEVGDTAEHIVQMMELESAGEV